MTDISKVNSPAEFLAYLQGSRKNPPPVGEVNEDFQEIFLKKYRALQKQGQSADFDIEKADVFQAHHAIISELWKSVTACLTPNERKLFENTLAVGVLEHRFVNAICARHPRGFYAILIHNGLIILFNKLSKLISAGIDPSAIEYCNRDIGKDLNSETIFEWYLETLDNYRETGIPLGPQIHLVDDAQGAHGARLRIWETFVLCHELGHFMCGHLESEDRWVGDPELMMMERYSNKGDHSLEHEADVYAYLLMRELVNNPNFGLTNIAGEFEERALLLGVVSLMDVQYLLGGTGGRSHPDSINRGIAIAEIVYGMEVATALEESYESLGQESALLSIDLNPILTRAEFLKSVSGS